MANRDLAGLMTKGVAHRVSIVGPHGARTDGDVRTETYGSSRRLVRAVRVAATLLGLAIVSVLIPAAHFVLVPAFLIASPIAGYFAYREAHVVLGGRGTCPACGEAFVILRAREEWPMRDVCERCRAPVSIELAD